MSPPACRREYARGSLGDTVAEAHKGQGPITLHLLLLITTGRGTVQLLHYLSISIVQN